ncbi:hypothetical protein KPL78_01835 [Roseomonas sp. HJA6]|uniref:DUF58 domain-containing protein n=1 Tax=Roseomonas alba TaxID=2846776 RepID=A0ABS7A318_9PROT|nr:hypothetical protein [Neoroseomonas alba]
MFGRDRIGAGWIGIGIAGAAFVVVAAVQAAIGSPVVMLAVGPVLGMFALGCAVTRQVRIDPSRGEVVVSRRVLGLAVARRVPLDRFGAVVVRMEIIRPRRSVSDLSLRGDQVHAHYGLSLEGRRRVRLEWLLPPGEPAARRDAAEGLARTLAGRLGLVAERRGYAVESAPDGVVLSVPRRGVSARL